MHTLARVFRFLRQRKFAAVHAACDNDSLGRVDMFLCLDDLRCFLQADPLDGIELIDDSPEAFCLLLHGCNEILSRNLGKARIVLNADRIRDLSPNDTIFQHQNRKIHAPRVQRGSQSRHARPDDDKVFLDSVLWHKMLLPPY